MIVKNFKEFVNKYTFLFGAKFSIFVEVVLNNKLTNYNFKNFTKKCLY